MARPRVIAMMVIAAATTLGAGSAAQADVRAGIGVTISPHVGLGVWVGSPPRRPIVVAPPRREVFVRPYRHRFHRLGPPLPAPILVPSPMYERVVVPGPPPSRVEVASITVWITNSNGSRTSVKLTREGPYYIGPRGELYTSLPTNEQLRIVYGF